jgi:thiol-disulfide isomerase/thioredoxin
MKVAVFVIFLICPLPTQKPTVIKLSELKAMILEPSEKLKVVNFWATWCAPCIKELPYFEKLNEERADVEVILVSLDLDLDPNPEKVNKFVSRRGIKSKVLLLDERDPDSWIDQIDQTWSGALPATLIVNSKTGQRKFIGKELAPGELNKLVEEMN